MHQVDSALNSLLLLFHAAVNAVLAGLAAVEQWLRIQLTGLGVAPSLQTAVMLAVAVLLIVLVLRVFGGVIRVLLIVFLVLWALHVVLPLAHA